MADPQARPAVVSEAALEAAVVAEAECRHSGTQYACTDCFAMALDDFALQAISNVEKGRIRQAYEKGVKEMRELCASKMRGFGAEALADKIRKLPNDGAPGEKATSPELLEAMRRNCKACRGTRTQGGGRACRHCVPDGAPGGGPKSLQVLIEGPDEGGLISGLMWAVDHCGQCGGKGELPPSRITTMQLGSRICPACAPAREKLKELGCEK